MTHERSPLVQVALAVYLGLNIGLSLHSLRDVPHEPDWSLWLALPTAIAEGRIYDLPTEAPFVWSPLMAWVMGFAATQLGFVLWGAIHVAVLALIRDPLIILLAITSWAFWTDVAMGNTLVFVFVAGVLALRGNLPAAHLYLAMLILMPRPVQLPLAAWLLMARPETRVPFVVIAAVHGVAVVLMGYAGDWLSALMTQGQQHRFDIGPGFWIGGWWLLIGIPFGLWLAHRRLLGLAGLAISPYLLPQYLLMPLLDLPRLRPPGWGRLGRALRGESEAGHAR